MIIIWFFINQLVITLEKSGELQRFAIAGSIGISKTGTAMQLKSLGTDDHGGGECANSVQHDEDDRLRYS